MSRTVVGQGLLVALLVVAAAPSCEGGAWRARARCEDEACRPLPGVYRFGIYIYPLNFDTEESNESLEGCVDDLKELKRLLSN